MTISSSAGTLLGIIATAPATYNAAGFDALAFTNIGEITDLGEFGRRYNLITHNPVASRGTVKLKGSYNSGTMDLPMALDMADAGQDICRTAANSDADYYFKLTLPTGVIFYFAAKVMSFVVQVGSVDSVTAATVSLELTAQSSGADIVIKEP